MVEILDNGRYRCERLGCGAVFEAEREARSHEVDRIPHIVICAASELFPKPIDIRYHRGFVVAIRKLGEIKPLSKGIYETPADADAEAEKSVLIECARLGNKIRYKR
ncbi:hypothetical protein HYU96_03600 [Candidatus Daviesbacteria bacterium]|nr:hypothetical protein [Candidatus Daviesbacteria bacterium]